MNLSLEEKIIVKTFSQNWKGPTKPLKIMGMLDLSWDGSAGGISLHIIERVKISATPSLSL